MNHSISSDWLLPPKEGAEESMMAFMKDYGIESLSSRHQFSKSKSPARPARRSMSRRSPASYPSPFLQPKTASSLPPPLAMPAAQVLISSTPLAALAGRSSGSGGGAKQLQKVHAPLRAVTNVDHARRAAEKVKAKSTPAIAPPKRGRSVTIAPSALPKQAKAASASAASDSARKRARTTTFAATAVAPRLRQCPVVRLRPLDSDTEGAVLAVRRNPFIQVDLPQWRSLHDLVGEMQKNWAAAAPWAAGRPLRLSFEDSASGAALDPSLTCAQLFSVKELDFANPLQLKYCWGPSGGSNSSTEEVEVVGEVSPTAAAAAVRQGAAVAALACAQPQLPPQQTAPLPPPSSRRRIDAPRRKDAIEPLPLPGARS